MNVFTSSLICFLVIAVSTQAVHAGEGIVFNNRGDIYMYTPGQDDPINITNSPEDEYVPVLSPDGTLIAYNMIERKGDEDNFQLWVMNSNGSGKKKIVDNLGCLYPRFTPDGKKIIFGTAHPNFGNFMNYNSFYTVNTDGSDLKKITGTEGLIYMPLMMNNGKLIFSIFARDNVNILDLGTKEYKPLIEYENEDHFNGDFALSPDNGFLCYIEQKESDGGFIDQNWMYLLNMETGEKKLLFDPGKGVIIDYPSFSPDGSRILFTYDTGSWEEPGRNIIIDVNTLETENILEGMHVAFPFWN